MRMRLAKISLWIVASICVFGNDARAQEDRKPSGLVVPAVFYTPETRWGFGFAGSYNFYLNPADTVSPTSQIQAGLTYTQNKQFLAYLPFNLFWSERKWQASGQLGWYRYNYYFYGVGNEVAPEFEEYYAIDFSRIRLQLTRHLYGPWYVGARMWMDDFSLPQDQLDPMGILVQQTVSGWDGGRVVGGGLTVAYDTRDNVYSSSKGLFVEMVVQDHSNFWLGEFNFSKYRLEAKGFVPLPLDMVLGAQMLTIHARGDVPFNHMGMVGGSFINRGYYEGRYRDKSMLSGQSELRFDIWRKFGGVLFGSGGFVGKTADDFALNHARVAGGVGLRYDLDPEKGIKIRMDYAWGKGSSGFYLTFGEAF